jgi:nucleoside-diphosphate-sugar epimerase
VTGMLDYRGVRVLVLGGGGFIGRQVARQLGLAGASLHLASRTPDRIADELARLGLTGIPLHTDLSRPGAGAELIRSVRPSITFNLAGYGVDPAERDPVVAEQINHILVAELAEAAGAMANPEWAGQDLVHAGSAAEFGAATGPLGEDTPPEPSSLYGRTKLAGTGAVGRATAAGTVRGIPVRLFTVYGPGERSGRLLPALIAAARSGHDLPLTAGEQRRDFTYVEDVAEGLLRLGMVAGQAPGPVNLATGRLESVRRFAERAATVLGLPAARLRFGALPGRPNELAHGAVNIARLRALCDWVPATTIEEGVRRTVQTS